MKKLLVLCLIIPLLSCGKKGNYGENEGSYSPQDTDMVVSALGVISSALNDQEQVNQLALYRAAPHPLWDLLVPSAYAASECNRSRFSPYLGPASSCSGTAGDKTVMVHYNGCHPGGFSYLSLYGTAQMSFSSPETCNAWIKGEGMPTSGSVTRTTNNYQRLSGRLSVSMDSTDQENYEGVLVGGGVITAFAPSYHEVMVLGVTRIGRWNDKVIFNHSIITPVPLFVTGNKEDNNRTIASGGIQIDDNLKGYKLNATVSGLPFVNNCCYPVGGSLSFVRTGGATGSMTVNFSSTCGQISGDIDGASFTTTLRSCE